MIFKCERESDRGLCFISHFHVFLHTGKSNDFVFSLHRYRITRINSWDESVKSEWFSFEFRSDILIFAIINEILMLKVEYWSSIIFYSNIINFTEKKQETKILYFLLSILYRILTKILLNLTKILYRIFFSKNFFQNFWSILFNTAFSYCYQHQKKLLKNSEKKFSELYEKEISNFVFCYFSVKLIVFE